MVYELRIVFCTIFERILKIELEANIMIYIYIHIYILKLTLVSSHKKNHKID